MKKLIFSLSITLLIFGCKSNQYADLGDGIFATIKTSKGDMILQLEPEKTPVTVANFISLAEGESPYVSEEYKNKPFYDGLTFHRVMEGFMIQAGDPLGNGMGGPGYRFKDEFDDSLKHDTIGVVSMANGGPGTNGSQFFITHEVTDWLDGVHSVFGHLVLGYDVLDSIANVMVDARNKPLDSVVMEEVKIVRNGKEARKFDALEIMANYFEEKKILDAEAAKRQEEINQKLVDVKAGYAAQFATQKSQAESWPSGLQVLKIVDGTGPQPKAGSRVMVNYVGWLEDGTLFDTSVPEIAREYFMEEQLVRMHRGDLAPAPMVVSPDARLITGFKEALLSMRVGDKLRVFIPPHLGYGAQGSGPIPANAQLVFELEMLSLVE